MEYFDVVDEYGEPTGEVVERTIAHRDGIRHRTSHVWIVRMRDGRPQILLQKRCAQKDSYPGCYDISSAGHIPAGDEYVGSALRELREELGVEAEGSQLIPCGMRTSGSDHVFHGKEFHDRQISKVFILWLDREEDAFSPQPEEIESVRWMDFEECKTAVRHKTIPNCIYPEELDMIEPFLQPEKKD